MLKLSGLRQVDPLLPRLFAQTVVTSVGFGLFSTASVVFYVRHLHVSPRTVGFALSVAGVVALVTSLPAGWLADRFRPRMYWVWADVGQAAVFAVLPFVRNATSFLVVVSLLAVAEVAVTSARVTYLLGALDSANRVRARAYVRTAFNLGFTVGAVIAAGALLFESPLIYLALLAGNALALLVDALFILRLPEVTRPSSADGGPAGRSRAALRDLPMLAISGVTGVLLTDRTVLNVVLPAMVATRPDMPVATSAWLIAVNTVMVIFLQVAFARGSDTALGAARSATRAACALALACVALLASAHTGLIGGVVLLAVGAVLLTCGELWQSAASWGLSSELTPPALRGSYLAVLRLGGQVERVVGPLLLVGALVGGGPWGWLVLAFLYVTAGVVIGPLTRWAERTPRVGVSASPLVGG